MRLNKRVGLFFILFFLSFAAFASLVKVGIMSGNKITSGILTLSSGSYEIYGNGRKIISLNDANTSISFSSNNNFIHLKRADKIIGEFSSVKLVGIDTSNSFKIKINSITQPSVYEDNLNISSSKGNIKLVNFIDVDNYIEGVLEAEIGKTAFPEFLKVQAIICRTYALSHTHRHKEQGFELCDQMHCQVYKGKVRFNFAIISAVQATKGKIIISSDLKLITSAFHSNCGGQTSNSEDTWSKSMTYLKSVKDSFCLDQPHSNWEQSIPLNDWLSYLKLKGVQLIDIKDTNTSFSYIPSEREAYYVYKDINIPLKVIRNDWNLKSAYFSIQEAGDTLFFQGRGFGHGVGLCQEGAIRMSEQGYSYEQILKYYYKDIAVISLEALRLLTE